MVSKPTLKIRGREPAGPAQELVSPVQDENVQPLVQKFLWISRKQQPSMKPSLGPF